MHIRALLGAALLGLAMLASAPAMATPIDDPPEICVRDFAQPAIDLVAPVTPTCEATDVTDVSASFDSTGGDEGEAAWPSCAPPVTSLDLALYRIHVDPGRCPA